MNFVTEKRKASISGVQRQFRIGYNRAARIIEQMEAQGIVSEQGHNGNREVLAPPPFASTPVLRRRSPTAAVMPFRTGRVISGSSGQICSTGT